ncbi:hypothetical protein PG993_011491 [Apiospora rasikravindrae]|uniref:Uncharacterized protein n=1 Tax=Apiospora rasikravindrae TaxID=990691 RepID=A0ABR1SED0_9PEZI
MSDTAKDAPTIPTINKTCLPPDNSTAVLSTPWSFVTWFFRTPAQEWLDGLPKDAEGFEDLVWADDNDDDGRAPEDSDLLDFIVDDYWVYIGTRADLREKQRLREALLRGPHKKEAKRETEVMAHST